MSENNPGRYIVAFEIGSSKVRGAVGVVDNAGVVDVIAVEEEKIIDKVRYGCIQNIDISNSLRMVIERLEAYPAIEPREITGVYVALGGRSLSSSMVDTSISLSEETEITMPLIQDLVAKARATIGADRDVVEVVPVRFTVDNKLQNNPVGTFGTQIGARMMVLSCAQQIKRMLRRVINDRLALDINGYIPRPLAEAEIVLTDDERRLGCMFVDFGAETTTVAIYRQGYPVYVATLPMGSRNITLDLTSLNYLEERAEEIKKVSGNALPQDPTRRRQGLDGIDYTEINNYVHARADEIVANIIAQLGYAGMKDSELPGGIVIVGGGARLRGFNELLANQSKLKVRQGAVSANVRITDGSIHGSEVIDVISVISAAAEMPDVPCMTELPEDTYQDHRPESYEDFEPESEGEGVSRIGSLDDEPDRATKEDKDRVKKEKEKRKENEDDNSADSRSSILESLRHRISNMFNDNSEFIQ